MIWDIPKEKFHSITKTYYQDTHGVIITFDITDINSFKSVRLWKKEFDDNMPYEPVKILVGNKCDKSERKVSSEEGNSLSNDFNMKYFEISALMVTMLPENSESIRSFLPTAQISSISKSLTCLTNSRPIPPVAPVIIAMFFITVLLLTTK